MKRTLMVMAGTCMLFACKKEKDNTPGCPINMNSLSGSYKLTALQYKADANAAPADYLAFMDDCEKDDILVLQSDGIYKEEDAGTLCDPKEADEGTWQVHGNTLVSDGKLNGTIASYDCKTMVYYVENTMTPGDKLTFTLEKQ